MLKKCVTFLLCLALIFSMTSVTYAAEITGAGAGVSPIPPGTGITILGVDPPPVIKL